MIKDFFNQWLGKPVEVEDPSNLDQCFDWAFKYCDFLGVPHSAIRHLYAYQIFTDATDETRKYFDLIPNSPDGVPQAGDIVVFDKGVGVAGHVSVATGVGDTNSFQSTDQNWGGHLYVEYVTHNYDFGPVLGWLRPKVAGGTTGNGALPANYADIIRKSSNWDEVEKLGYISIAALQQALKDCQTKQGVIENLNQQINDRNQDITRLNGEINTLTDQIKILTTRNASFQQLAVKVPPLEKLLSQAEKSRDTCLMAQSTQNKIIAQLRNTSYTTSRSKPLVVELLKRLFRVK